MKTIDRIIQLLDEQGVPERSRRSLVSKITKASYESVRKWFAGDTQEIGTEYLSRLAKYFNRPVDWFLGDGREHGKIKEESGSYDIAPMIMVKKKQITSLIDDGIDSIDEVELLEGPAAAIGSQYRSAFAFIETADGMSPHIYPGDTIMIDPSQNTPNTGADCVWLFRAGDGVTLGKVYETIRGLVLKFDNQDTGWEPMPVSESDCIGKVVGLIPRWLAG